MNYGASAYSPAIYWGQYNEKKALDAFRKAARRCHKKLEIHACGLYIYDRLPIIAGTPDAVATCECHGTSPVEVKNPYKYRGLSIHKLAEQEDSCLKIDIGSGRIFLDPCHPYYTQVQPQILVLNSETGFFCLKTVSPYDNFHWEEIVFDPMYMEEVLEKATIIFKEVIIPEILQGVVKQSMLSEQCASNDETSAAIVCFKDTKKVFVSDAAEYPCNVCKKECVDEPLTSDGWLVEWGFYALSASKAIFRARTYNCNLFSPVRLIT